MMRTFVFIGSVALLAQSADTPRFEVADVHVSAHTPNPNARGGVLRGGRYELRTANMVDLIGVAYGVDADKVLGGPSWLESDRFDVIAKAPASTPPETVKLMLQSLLADRFKLVVHKETKPLPSYALTVGKGKPKLKEADGSGDTGSKFTLEPRPAPEAGGPVSPVLLYACHNMTMAAFVEGMRTMVGSQQYVGRNQVVDQTGLKGSWDFNFKYSLPLRVPPAVAVGADMITLLDAVDKQLGLKLDPAKIPVSVIVVDSANRKPTGNSPGVTTSLPALPTEFEVADVRPSDPDSQGVRLQIQPAGK
jgi:uncharacterized protein (TIGR03435 family)